MSESNSPITDAWREALDRLDTLSQLSAEERAQVLESLASSAPQLHSLVALLLDAQREAFDRNFLEPPSHARPASDALRADSQIGPYRLVEPIGQGGMGEVWRACRDDGLFEGEVAIKTLHPYFAGGALRDRFLREAQLLGRLAHPNIARLIDAGVSTDGLVYLVLEYVRGQPLDTWCDSRKLDVEARLKLFVDVCAAVAHAHANLIVHRDLKPSNILVSENGQVKLLDFGVAKLVEVEAEERTELTRLTGRIFTPEYAAPEQILGTAITTATDVYALGVLLHVLLSGTRPYATEDTAPALEHAVLHDEPTRASRACAGAENAIDIAAKRSSTVSRLQRALSGDIDSIIRHAMQKLPAERFPSVLALADDVRRHLNHQPVLARSESLRGRAAKFVRRHRVGVAATGVVAFSLIVGVAGIAWQARVAREQARVAALEAQKAAAVKDFLLDIFNANSESNPEGAQARQTTAEELLAVASDKILDAVERDPDVRLELMATLGQLNLTLEKYTQVEALQRERVRFATERFGPTDLRVAAALGDLATFLRQRGRYDEARLSIESALRIMDAAGDRNSLQRGRAEARLAQIAYMQSDGKDSAPVDHYLVAMRILERLAPSDELVDATLGLARSYELAGHLEEAVATNRRGIELAVAVNGPRDTSVGGGHQQLARALAKLHRLTEAEADLSQAIEVFTFAVGPENGFTTMARLDAGRMMILRGRYREAAVELEQVLAIRTQVDGPTNHWVQETRSALAQALLAIGDVARARSLLDEAIEVTATTPKQNVRLVMLRARAAVALEQERPADALSDVDLALQGAGGLQGQNGQRRATLLVSRGEALIALDRLEDARVALTEALGLLARTETDPRHPEQLRARLALAAADLAAARYGPAHDAVVRALDEVSAQSSREELWLIEELAQLRLADVLRAQGRAENACVALESALALRKTHSISSDTRLQKLEAQWTRSGCPRKSQLAGVSI